MDRAKNTSSLIVGGCKYSKPNAHAVNQAVQLPYPSFIRPWYYFTTVNSSYAAVSQ